MKTYLEKQFKNNELIEKLTIKTKINSRLIGFIICSIIYPLIRLSKYYNVLYDTGEVTSSNIVGYIEIIMLIATIISCIGLVWLLLDLFIPRLSVWVKTHTSFKARKGLFTILDWGFIFILCCLISLFCYSCIFVIAPVSGSSMNPVINDGESVLVFYGNDVERFDVVVLKVTKEDNFKVYENSFYIKRIIGLPGDKVTWVDKTLFINNEIVDESFLPEGYLDQLRITNDFIGLFKYKEEVEKDGKKEIVTRTTYIIPEGYYFVMGDNREGINSKDSRDIGLIPEDNIIGIAKYFVKGIIPWGKIE